MCPSRLGHSRGLREQHPDSVQKYSTFLSSLTYILYIAHAYFFKTNR